MKKVVTILLLLLVTSCTTVKYVEVPKITHDTIVHNNNILVRDSTYQSDKTETVNDTVYRTQYKYIEKKVYVTVRDSILRTDTITVPIPVEVEKEVVKYKMSGYGLLGWVLLFLLGGYLIYHRIQNIRNQINT